MAAAEYLLFVSIAQLAYHAEMSVTIFVDHWPENR